MVTLSQFTPQGHGGVEVYVHSFFILEMDVGNQLYSPVALPPWKCFSVSCQHATGGSESWSRYYAEKNLSPSPRIKPLFLCYWVRTLASIWTTLCLVLYLQYYRVLVSFLSVSLFVNVTLPIGLSSSCYQRQSTPRYPLFVQIFWKVQIMKRIFVCVCEG
jgi:hypothetical protein